MFGNNSFNNNGFQSLDLNTDLNSLQTGSLIQQTYDFGIHQQQTKNTAVMSIEIRKIYLGMTRPQADQHRRSYDVGLTGIGEKVIEEEVDRYGLDAFKPQHISSILAKGANFIKHSGTTDGAVNIDNGWDFDRFRFTMVVDCYRNGEFSHTEFISGYTDHAGVNNAGLISTVAIDPNMVFTINHISEARLRNVIGGRPTPMISRTNAVVKNHEYTGFGTSNQYLTRPSDVLRAVDKVAVYKGMQEADQLGVPAAGTYQDLDSMLTKMPMLSNDTNALIPTFASRTLTNLYQNSLTDFDPMNLDGNSPGAMAAINTGDTPFGSSSFINVMNRRMANGVSSTARFTFGDLVMMDPTVDDRTDVFGRSYETGLISIPDGRSVASIADSQQISVHATSIAHSTLALMSIAGVATLAYSATNMQTGMNEVTLQACDGMDNDGMLHQRLEVLKNRLIIECLSMVAFEAEYEVDVFADAFNDVFIQMTWNGVRQDYVFPAYASSSVAPIVTNNVDRLLGMAEAIVEVVDVCKNVISPNQNSGGLGNINIQGNGESRFGGLAGDF